MWRALSLGTACVICTALSAQTTSWSHPPAPILQPGLPGQWDDVAVYAPRFLKRGDGSPYIDANGFYYLYYTGTGLRTRPRDETGLARSKNLQQWQRVSAARPILELGPDGRYDQGDVSAVTVLEDGGTFHMWFESNGRVVDSDYVTISYATSRDGISWTRFAGNPILRQGSGDDREDLYAPIVIKDDDGIWKMWYTGHDDAGRYGLMAATSIAPEGPWLKVRDTFVFYPDSIFPSEVWKEEGVYHMLYMQGPLLDIRLATSIDGVTWIPRGVVFNPGPTRAWDSRYVRWPSQIPVATGWATAYSGTGFGMLGIGITMSDARYGFVSGGTGAPGPPLRPRASASGHRMRVTWDAPISGDPVDSYSIDVGTSFGAADYGNARVSGGRNEVVFSLPDNTYYVRVRAINRAGESPPSHDARVVVGSCLDQWNRQRTNGPPDC